MKFDVRARMRRAMDLVQAAAAVAFAPRPLHLAMAVLELDRQMDEASAEIARLQRRIRAAEAVLRGARVPDEARADDCRNVDGERAS